MNLGKPQLMKFGANSVSDHNRGPVSIDPERIGNSQRMADGTMRKFYVADKNKITCSWENLPGKATNTVDKFWGANDIENHYRVTSVPFTLTLTFADGSTTIMNVMWDNFSKEISKRGFDDLYSVSISLDEV